MKNPIGISFHRLSRRSDDLSTIQDVIMFWLFDDFKKYFNQNCSYGDYVQYLATDYDQSTKNISFLFDMKSIPNQQWRLHGTISDCGVIVDISEEHLLELKLTYA